MEIPVNEKLCARDEFMGSEPCDTQWADAPMSAAG